MIFHCFDVVATFVGTYQPKDRHKPGVAAMLVEAWKLESNERTEGPLLDGRTEQGKRPLRRHRSRRRGKRFASKMVWEAPDESESLQLKCRQASRQAVSSRAAQQ